MYLKITQKLCEIYSKFSVKLQIFYSVMYIEIYADPSVCMCTFTAIVHCRI